MGTQRKLRSQVKRILILGLIVSGIATLIFGCERSAKKESSKQPSTAETDPLAQPKSLQQVGVAVELTRDAISADNTQSPEKISIGLNALYNKTQFWDGRAETLEEQAGFPVINPSEMGHPNLDAAVAQIASVEEYQQAFQRVFGRTPNGPDLVRAIASYERTQLSFDSPFDHFITGDNNAIDDSAKRGWELFNTQARCNKCHALTETQRDVTLFTDNDFHNIGIGIIRHNVVALAGQAELLVKSGDTAAIDRAAIQNDMSVLGRFLITKQDKDTASFKTPDIRNVLVTGPYFHDGSQETLWDVIDHYNKGDGLHNPWLDEDMQPLALTESQIDDLVAFLASLTSATYKEQGEAELARQRALSRTTRPQRDTTRAFGPKPTQPEPPK